MREFHLAHHARWWFLSCSICIPSTAGRFAYLAGSACMEAHDLYEGEDDGKK